MVNDGRIKVIIICSGKSDTFIAGADIDEMYPVVNLNTAIHVRRFSPVFVVLLNLLLIRLPNPANMCSTESHR